jgi:hypothetical protein
MLRSMNKKPAPIPMVYRLIALALFVVLVMWLIML